MPETELRRLAAIMFTDIVGFSALTQQNEARALALLAEHRRLLSAIFPAYGGRIVNTTGDGFFVEFASALNAVRCAVEIQRRAVQRNSQTPPEARLQVRIGIHLGDVVHREHDVVGDGVNIAARIEPLAEPGGITLSQDVARQIVNKIDLPVRKLGKRELKNIHLPVEIYSIALDGRPRRPPFTHRFLRRWSTRGSPVVLVGLVSALALGHWLTVPRGAIQRPPGTATSKASSGSAHQEAMRFYEEGMSVLNHAVLSENEEAVNAFKKAADLDPSFAEAHAELAQAYWNKFSFLAHGGGRLEEQADYEVNRALGLNPDCAEAHLVRGILDWTPMSHFQVRQALAELHRALALNSRLEGAYFNRGVIYLHLGLFPEALRDLRRAAETQPFDTRAWMVIAQAHVYDGKYQTALKELDRTAPSFQPAMWSAHKAMALLCLGRSHEASEVLQAYLAGTPKDPGGVVTSTQAILDAAAGHEAQAQEEINTAIADGSGFLHFHHAEYNIACAYALMNDRRRALESLQDCAEDGFPCYPMFAKSPLLNHLRTDPHFRVFLKQQKQQWELAKQLVSRD